MRGPSNPAIYLAGKIQKNGWRNQVVEDVDTGAVLDMLVRTKNLWPRTRRAVVGYFDYVGPYFTACDHGCAHNPVDPVRYVVENAAVHGGPGSGGLHGVAQELCGNAPPPRLVRDLCLTAVRDCDLLVAWIDALDCYGTLLEIGYGLALDKPLVIAMARGIEPRELWLSLASARFYGWFGSPGEALFYLRGRVESEGLAKAVSPNQGCVHGAPPNTWALGELRSLARTRKEAP